MARDFAIALSLANLLFFVVWADLLPGSPAHYFIRFPPPRAAYAAAAVNVLVAATALFAAGRLVRRMRRPLVTRLAEVGFLLLVLTAANGLRLRVPALASPDTIEMIHGAGWYALPLLLVAGAMAAFLRWRHAVLRLAVGLVLVMAPFTVVTFGRAAWTWIRYERAFEHFEGTRATAVLARDEVKEPRVLWLVFDELDAHIAFEARPAGIELPQFDRLGNQSLVATDAHSPADDTLRSMPALIVGKSVIRAYPSGASDLMLHLAGSSRPVPWSRQENIFSRARSAGVSSGVVGTYHPYCRVIGHLLTTCSWHHWPRGVWAAAPATLLAHGLQIASAVPGARRVGLLQPLRTLTGSSWGRARRAQAIVSFQQSLAETIRMATHPGLRLVFAHLPVPHPPYIYERASGELRDSGASSYLDNLALADRALGDIRRAMVDAALWDRTSVLVTADHGYRADLWQAKIPENGEEAKAAAGSGGTHVPFIVKLACQSHAVEYSGRLNTIVAHDLILALLEGEIDNVASALAWLHARSEGTDRTARGA